MVTLPRLTARLAAIIPFAALLAAACSPDSNGPSSPALLADRALRLSTLAVASSGPSLGAASSFALLGGSAVTCTGSTIPVTATGDVGVFLPTNTGVALTNCTVVTGTVHPADAIAAQAGIDFFSAYDALAPKTGDCDAAHTLGSTIASMTLSPGVYCTGAALTATDVTLTLDGRGDANAVWIFKIGTILGGGALTGSNFSVAMINGGQACNVSWWTAEAATLTWTTTPSTTPNFVGTILAGAGITFTGMTSAPGSFVGRALAKAGVTVTDMNVTNNCGAAGPPPCKVSEDRVTGGGFITLPSGAKGTFGVSGGINIKKNAFRGHLEYNDHGPNGPRVKGTGVTAYVVVDAVTRHIEGTAEINGQGGFTYKVDVADNGEPGRNDSFSLSLSNGYSASGKLAGGNIQLHKSDGRACKEHDGDDEENDDGDQDHDDHGHDGHEGH